MSNRSDVTIAPRLTSDAFLEWAASFDEGCISVGGLALEMGWPVHPGPLKRRSMHFGPLIAGTREDMGLTAEQFAARIGVSLAELA